MKLRIVLFGYLVIVGLPLVSFGKEIAATKAVAVTSADPEIIVKCLGVKTKITSSDSVRVYIHYRIVNDSQKEKLGILYFKAHCPFKNELSNLEGGFVVTNRAFLMFPERRFVYLAMVRLMKLMKWNDVFVPDIN